ncbi:hypothetical protein CHARACLAT_031846 [Characodon lateralis]|uniref:Interleukin n=1 Tax=Characodon lateralis TaxID=208331 RepID=A0ABU7ESB4_9TELE|nr:hypothetical protein [Characodon lateralis]
MHADIIQNLTLFCVLLEYMDELKQYSPTYFQWAESEEELAEPLKGIGSCLERCSKETEEQIQQLSEVLVPALHEYVLCADTLKLQDRQTRGKQNPVLCQICCKIPNLSSIITPQSARQ